MATIFDFKNQIEKEKDSLFYKNYIETRDIVFKMLEEEKNAGFVPSAYYKEEMVGLEYMLDASPFIVKKLRHHCHHITGVKEYEYRSHHRKRAQDFEKKLSELKNADKWNLFVSENRLLGGFGFEKNGELYNADTFKYYECLIAMQKGGVLDQFRKKEKKIVLEIGGGWGGLAYQFKKIFPQVVYVTVDLPMSMIFSITYLKTVFPNASFFISDGEKKDFSDFDIKKYDFVFFPYFLWEKLNFQKPDLVINTVGFQEMSEMQISNYAKKIKDWGCDFIYSMNRDRSPYNFELSTVREVLGRFCKIFQVNVLDVPHYDMKGKNFLQKVKTFIKKIFGVKSNQGIHEYKHLIGNFK